MHFHQKKMTLIIGYCKIMIKLDGLNSKDFNNLISLSFLSEKIALNQ